LGFPAPPSELRPPLELPAPPMFTEPPTPLAPDELLPHAGVPSRAVNKQPRRVHAEADDGVL